MAKFSHHTQQFTTPREGHSTEKWDSNNKEPSPHFVLMMSSLVFLPIRSTNSFFFQQTVVTDGGKSLRHNQVWTHLGWGLPDSPTVFLSLWLSGKSRSKTWEDHVALPKWWQLSGYPNSINLGINFWSLNIYSLGTTTLPTVSGEACPVVYLGDITWRHMDGRNRSIGWHHGNFSGSYERQE